MCVLCALYMDRLREYFLGPQRDVPAVFDFATGKNILWKSPVGSNAGGSPVIVDDKVYVGTNNTQGYLSRYPPNVDLGVLLCFDARNGNLLWQASSKKLSNRAHDWPYNGLSGTPLIEGNRLWYITNRSELVCLDTEGFYDHEDDGVAESDDVTGREKEADVVWRLDMIKQLGVTPFDTCFNVRGNSVCIDGDIVFAVTGHSMKLQKHRKILNPNAPSFIAVDKNTGKLLWSDSSSSRNAKDQQTGTPTCARLGGVPQVIFPGGDGWLYSFDIRDVRRGKAEPLWKFDCNPKDSSWTWNSTNLRSSVLGAVTVDTGRVFVCVGRTKDHERPGRVWCIDPTKRGDVSPELVFNKAAPNVLIADKVPVACDQQAGDFTRPNPNSAAIWQYTGRDKNGNGNLAIDERMNSSVSRVIVHDDLVFACDGAAILHCVDANTGKMHWSYDLLAASTSAPVVSEDYVFTMSEDGEVLVFGLSKDPKVAMPGGKPIHRIHAPATITASSAIDKNVLYILSSETLYAIAEPPKE